MSFTPPLWKDRTSFHSGGHHPPHVEKIVQEGQRILASGNQNFASLMKPIFREEHMCWENMMVYETETETLEDLATLHTIVYYPDTNSLYCGGPRTMQEAIEDKPESPWIHSLPWILI